MTGIEILIALVIAVWVLKNALVDVSFAVRGQPSPRMAARAGRGEAGRYLSGLWSDTWRGMRERREARLSGATPPPRAQSRLGQAFAGLRGRVTGWWDRSTTRVDNRRQAELIQGQERLHTSRWDRLKDRVMGRDADAWPQTQRKPGEDFAGRPTDQQTKSADREPAKPDEPQHDPQPKPDPQPDPQRINGQTVAQTEPEPVHLDSAPHRTPIDNSSAQGAGEDQEENGMAEAKGLNPTINWCETAATSAETWKPRIESVQANLRLDDSSGPALEHLTKAGEAAQLMAASIRAAQAALITHRKVDESYAGTGYQAGTKEHLRRGA
jgi:hypothetical protein